MGRKKPRRVPAPPPKPPREEPFHAPFRELPKQWRAAGRNGATPPQPAPPAPSARPPRPLHAVRAEPSPEVLAQRDRALFLAEMSGVTPLPPDPRGRVDKRQQPVERLPVFLLDELEGLDDLRDLVEGRGPFTIQYTDEYMEGVAPGVDLRLAQRLHRGDYAVQAHLDLHGHTVDAAHVVVERFLIQAHAVGQRCVRLVHGRGLNSKDNRPVLKEQVRIWLSHGRLSRLVLAFATAPLTDGGAGAVYVLLRRIPRTPKK